MLLRRLMYGFSIKALQNGSSLNNLFAFFSFPKLAYNDKLFLSFFVFMTYENI